MSQKESVEKYLQIAKECDGWIKSGQMSRAAEIVAGLNLAQVPRAARLGLARICRRTGSIDQGLRLLQKLVRHEQLIEPDATASEVCEYASLLSRNGSLREAAELLQQVDAREVPEAALYQAYCHIANWEYEQAIAGLQTYLASEADEYAKLTARVNLGSAYAATFQPELGIQVLSETFEAARRRGAFRLAGNSLELRANIYVLSNQFDKAKADLDEALKILGQVNGFDRLFIHKWRAIMEARESGRAAPLAAVRAQALELRHWETVRETDLFALTVEFQQSRFDYLFFGTPKPAYRQRVLRLLPHSPSSEYILGDNQGRHIDLSEGDGKKIHQLLIALTRDFYAPVNTGALFAELYPDEYFDVDSSPVKIRQLIKRARRWLEDEELSALIEHSSGGYSLNPGPGLGFRMKLERGAASTHDAAFQKLVSHFGTGVPFTAKDACKTLQLSRSGFLDLANWASQRNLLARESAGKKTSYAIKKAG